MNRLLMASNPNLKLCRPLHPAEIVLELNVVRVGVEDVVGRCCPDRSRPPTIACRRCSWMCSAGRSRCANPASSSGRVYAQFGRE